LLAGAFIQLDSAAPALSSIHIATQAHHILKPMPSREALETSRASFDGKTRFRNAMRLHQQNIVTADLRDQV
jgi:hypothetical protein